MPVRVTIENSGEVQRFLELMPEATQNSIAASANKALEKAHTQALVGVARAYTISMQAAASDFKPRKASKGTLRAMLNIKGRPRGAREFNASPRLSPPPGRGLTSRRQTIEIKRGQSRSLSGYFWLHTKGGDHLFRFKYGNSRGPKGGRIRSGYKIFKTLTVPQMVENDAVLEPVVQAAEKTFSETFRAAMDRRLLKEAAR